jgi:hypothetical protein
MAEQHPDTMQVESSNLSVITHWLVTQRLEFRTFNPEI